MAITKKTRFEVFKRDSFKCQYCGRSAPEVLLHVDHVDPVSKGGGDDILNLITACFDCNMGKKDRRLDDQTVLAKQKAQLGELNERRAQLEMLLEWSVGLRELKESAIEQLAQHWELISGGYTLHDTGLDALRKLLRKYNYEQIIEGMDVAAESYFKRDKDSVFTHESVNLGWFKVPGIISLKSLPDSQRELYYIRGILRNRLAYCNNVEALRLLKDGLGAGLTIDDMKDWAREARTWTEWRNEMYRIIEERSHEAEE